MLTTDEQMTIILSGASEVVPQKELRAKLEKGKPLTIKLGVDPTSPDLHLGHAVPLRKMRQFQDLGHNVVLIIGDGTALIGDPSGRDTTRPTLTEEEIKNNAKTYVAQAEKILDPAKTKVVFNGDWIKPLSLKDMLSLMSNFTVARILERDDFSKRFHDNKSISLHEFMYPVLQAFDSVQINADVELGGTDQIFNLLAGRTLMEKEGMEPQIALTLPLLEGTDGTKKMSKSYGNYIALTDEASDMFGKVMSIPDELIAKYYRLASTLPVADVDRIEQQLREGAADPYALKRQLAINIVDLYHGEGAGLKAQDSFDALFKEHQRPEAQTVALALEPNESGNVYIPGLLKEAGLASSAGEARRLIDGGGIKINDEPLSPKTYELPLADIQNAFVQAGKRRAVQLETS